MQFSHFVGLAMLIAAVPLQIYLMKYNENFKQLVVEIVKKLPENMQNMSFDLTEYVRTAKDYLRKIYNFGTSNPDGNDDGSFSEEDAGDNQDDNDDDDDDDDDEDVPEHTIRSFRPPHLEFRVGDVVLTHDMTIGVIIGWSIDMSDLTKEPEYHILMNNEEMEFKEFQNHMIGIKNIKVNNTNINQYFKEYNGISYTPKKWLQKLYPKD